MSENDAARAWEERQDVKIDLGAMSPADARREIARDVIAAVKAGMIRVDHVYFNAHTSQMDGLLVDVQKAVRGKSCNACAIGACLYAVVTREDRLEARVGYSGVIAIRRAEIVARLEGYFDSFQLRLMENAYEQTTLARSRPRSSRTTLHITCGVGDFVHPAGSVAAQNSGSSASGGPNFTPCASSAARSAIRHSTGRHSLFTSSACPAASCASIAPLRAADSSRVRANTGSAAMRASSEILDVSVIRFDALTAPPRTPSSVQLRAV